MKVLITGASGFLGAAVLRVLSVAQPDWLIQYPKGRTAQDLRDPHQVQRLFRWVEPDLVIHLAYPGTDGIATAIDGMADLVRDQLRIDLNVIDAAAFYKAQKLICVGSVCAYPETVTFPTGEDQLYAGRPELMNEPYGQAKRMQISLLEAYHRQYGVASSHLILGNLYGPGDRSGHVIPSLVRRCLDAKAHAHASIEVWGDGTATREFLYVEDAAWAIVKAAEREAIEVPVNVCSGEEIPIADLTQAVMQAVGYEVPIAWRPDKPNGQPRRQFDNQRAKQLLNWYPTVRFREGLRRTVEWMRAETEVLG